MISCAGADGGDGTNRSHVRAPIISEFDGSGQCLGTVWTGTPLSSASSATDAPSPRHRRQRHHYRPTPPTDETTTLTSPSVTMMVAGHRHVVLCGSDGAVAVIRAVRDEKQLRVAQKKYYGVVAGHAKGDDAMDDEDGNDPSAKVPLGTRRHSIERSQKARVRDAAIRRSRGGAGPSHRPSVDMSRTGSNKMALGRSMMISGRKGGMVGGLLGDEASMEMGVVGGWTLPRVLGQRLHEEGVDQEEGTEEDEQEEEAEEEEEEEDGEEDEDEDEEGGLVSPPHPTKQQPQKGHGASPTDGVGVAEPATPTDGDCRIVAVCVHAIPGAGIEVLITATQAGRLAVYAVEGGRQVCAHDIKQGSSFLHDPLRGGVVALAAFDTQLYVATHSGTLLVVSLASLLVDGRLFDKDLAGHLKRHVAAEFPLFPGMTDVDGQSDAVDGAGRVVASIACVAPRTFLGLRNEDSTRIRLKSRSGVTTTSSHTSSACGTTASSLALRAAADARWEEVTPTPLHPAPII